jgi:hypothetical protein
MDDDIGHVIGRLAGCPVERRRTADSAMPRRRALLIFRFDETWF